MKPLSLIEFSFSMSLEHRKGKFEMSVLESEFQKRKQSPLMACCVVMFKNVGSRSKRRDSISGISSDTAAFSHLYPSGT